MGVGKFTPSHFRRKLVEELAFATPWARQQALRGKNVTLANMLGVTESVLMEAVDLIRTGFRPVDSKRSRRSSLVPLRSIVAVEVNQLWDNMAATVERTRVSFIRDLLHAAMQTTREPETPILYYNRKTSFRGKLLSGKRVYHRIYVSEALRTCVRRRAAARGLASHVYVRAWMTDLVEGRLGDLDIPSILPSQMFDDPEAYVLPAVPK